MSGVPTGAMTPGVTGPTVAVAISSGRPSCRPVAVTVSMAPTRSGVSGSRAASAPVSGTPSADHAYVMTSPTAKSAGSAVRSPPTCAAPTTVTVRRLLEAERLRTLEGRGAAGHGQDRHEGTRATRAARTTGARCPTRPRIDRPVPRGRVRRARTRAISSSRSGWDPRIAHSSSPVTRHGGRGALSTRPTEAHPRGARCLPELALRSSCLLATVRLRGGMPCAAVALGGQGRHVAQGNTDPGAALLGDQGLAWRGARRARTGSCAARTLPMTRTMATRCTGPKRSPRSATPSRTPTTGLTRPMIEAEVGPRIARARGTTGRRRRRCRGDRGRRAPPRRAGRGAVARPRRRARSAGGRGHPRRAATTSW